MPQQPQLSLGAEIGPFVIERLLGAGGMGVVYQARHRETGEQVALKLLGASLADFAGMARFGREIQAVSRLDHPGIARLLYAGQDANVCYYALELVDGQSLRDIVRRLAAWDGDGWGFVQALQTTAGQTPPVCRFDEPTAVWEPVQPSAAAPVNGLSQAALERIQKPEHLRQSCQIVRDAAIALQHAHLRGVVHRDLKPENLMLDTTGRTRVIDFGLARYFEDLTLTATGQLVGTPLYMSPEQVTGRGKVDERSDIYSLGLVLYELLTLRPAWKAPNREALLQRIVMKPLPPVNWLNAAIPADLVSIVHHASARDPDHRYRAAADLAADLNRFLAGQPAQAPAYDFPFDETEISSRRPEAIVGIAFVFYLALIPVVVGFVIAVIVAFSDSRPSLPGVLACLVSVGLMILCPATANGLLAARTWSRRSAQALLSSFLILEVAAFVWQQIQLRGNPSAGNWPLLLAILGMPVTIGVIWALGALRDSVVKRWFSLADQLRTDYRNQRETVLAEARPV